MTAKRKLPNASKGKAPGGDEWAIAVRFLLPVAFLTLRDIPGYGITG